MVCRWFVCRLALLRCALFHLWSQLLFGRLIWDCRRELPHPHGVLLVRWLIDHQRIALIADCQVPIQSLIHVNSSACIAYAISPGRYLISGRIEMESLEQILAMKFPEGNYETLGGFLMQQMGRIPKRRERTGYNGVTFIIENADQKSIKEIPVIQFE